MTRVVSAVLRRALAAHWHSVAFWGRYFMRSSQGISEFTPQPCSYSARSPTMPGPSISGGCRLPASLVI
jgi:hypothetical protein